MIRDTYGWIIVRVAEKGKPTEFLIPQKVFLRGGETKSADVSEASDVTIFASDHKLQDTLNAAKLSRPGSNLELRRCTVSMEIQDL